MHSRWPREVIVGELSAGRAVPETQRDIETIGRRGRVVGEVGDPQLATS
jgi:hypothetical protein